MQALCFLAGANSIFYGDKLLTTENPDEHHDRELFARLGIQPEKAAHTAAAHDAHQAHRATAARESQEQFAVT
jgi:biotin synthase